MRPNRMREFREQMGREGWSQEYLARRCGLALATVNRLEVGSREPNLRSARRIAKALGRTVSDVFPGQFDELAEAVS